MENDTSVLSRADALRLELEATRMGYDALLAELPEAAWEAPTANPGWNMRQLMFHIIIALRFLPQDVRILRSGRKLPVPVGLFNRANLLYTRWGARGQDKASPSRLYDKEHAALLTLLDTINDDEWDLSMKYPVINSNLGGGMRSMESMFRYISVHFEEHAAEVRAGVARWKGETP